MIVFDATMMLMLLRPGVNAPLDPATGKPVDNPEARISSLIRQLEKNKTKIIIPTPALSELLVTADKISSELIENIQKSSVFTIAPFDTLAAIEVAEMTRHAKVSGNKRGNAEGTWAKVKYDRQIIAIAKVNRAQTIYSDDVNLRNFAESVGIKVIGVADIPLPPEARQGNLLSYKPDDGNDG